MFQQYTTLRNIPKGTLFRLMKFQSKVKFRNLISAKFCRTSAGAAFWSHGEVSEEDLRWRALRDLWSPPVANGGSRGQVPLIGGVRNLNVPGDDDTSVNGVVRTELFYPGAHGILGNFTGDFLFRLSDAHTGAALATNVLRVRQRTQPQGFPQTYRSSRTPVPANSLLRSIQKQLLTS